MTDLSLDLELSDEPVKEPSLLDQLGERLISGLFVGSPEILKDRKALMLRELPPIAFRNEQYILYRVLQQFKTKDLQIDSEFLEIYLMRHRNLMTKASGNISLWDYKKDDSDPVDVFIASTLDYFDRVSALPPIPPQSYALDLEKYKIEYQAVEASRAYRDSLTILEDELRKGRETLSGYSDSRDYLRKRLAEIEGVVDSSEGTGFLTLDDIEVESASYATTVVGEYDGIPELNKHYGGISTRTLINIMAPNKGGKSKFCMRQAYTALTKFGTNVTYWPGENGVGIDSAQLRAIHFSEMANRGLSINDPNVKFGVDWTIIAHDRWEEMGHLDWKEIEFTYFEQLRSDPNYGSIDFIDRKLTFDNLLDDIDASVKRNNSKFVVIDYIQNLIPPRGMETHVAIERAYQDLLDYAKRSDVAIMSPVQIKQDVTDALAKNHENPELRSASAKSNEVLKAADLSLMLWASTQDLTRNRMRILSMPSRLASPMAPIDLSIDLGICKFVSRRK